MSETADYLEYLPPPRKPEGFDRKLAEIVGINPATNEPWLRFVWGCDRLDWTPPGQDLMRRYPDPDDKYVGAPYFILEGWQTPEVLNREEWKAGESLLGPFPERGTYDFIETLRDENFEMLPLGDLALQKAASWKFWKNKPKKVAIDQLLARMHMARELKAVRKKAAADKIWEQFQEDYAHAYEKKDRNPDSSLPSLPPLQKGETRTPAGLIVKNYG